MAYVTNTMEFIERANSYIDNNYDMTINNVNDIYKNSNHPIDMMNLAFKLGYMQGMRATRSELRKEQNND